ncbi:MAG: DUF5615 family PIN-like protein [Rhodoferax sp.]|nr:DUF5615 family PIN-like protein [Rhodoferax sp.]
MKLLANENIPMGMVRRLREMGHDVLAVGETSPGIADAVVLYLACRQQRTLLTFDRDYGELIYLKRLPVPMGVIYLRFAPTSPEDAVQQVALLLADEGRQVQGYFVVMDRDSYRRRPLPGPLA